ncbi:MAG TPA: LuxR family transcriptional regulator [Nocardioides sp.]|uniref:LuxR family transcriptional regulator n=1 Tax=uncultured Nocardioides sp. TaxID=198441 RepID=UPI000ECC690B|nr:LuxR family transcriptional regulator [uncultured Nocardioides sp.]HCB05797.1 LuxR family transcriptional regulator [Nocardioides sp.]HRD63792.1 LuxR family transcriptional regulator [Nocardioides sp.]HRI97719.1 LuxR family transcriptional regulator [Nocardioides sp.]HRK47341.1 LuxR family transcriptional regulator [Nocardioides sp.]
MPGYGAEERALFEDDATKLYEEVCQHGGIASSDYRIAEDGELRPAFDLLVEMGLLGYDTEQELWVPEDPTGVQSRVVSPLSQQAAKLLSESSQWNSAFSSLAQSWRRAPQASASGSITYLRGTAITSFLEQLLAECEEEMLTAQPQAGRDPRHLAKAALRDIALLESGASMRTLYQHSARRSSFTHKYVAAVTARGAEVRTLDEFFNRMIVVDHRVAVIPHQEQVGVAVIVREPAVVDYLVDVFERSWERGRPFTNRETSLLKDIAAEQRAMTMRMLIEGHSDPVSAKRLGVSPRTYAGYVADLKTEYDAETRFQLGYTMGRMGVSGHEEVTISEPDDDSTEPVD